MHGAYHVVKTHEIRPPDDAEQNGAPKRAHKSLDGLTRRQRKQWGLSYRDTPYKCEHVIADDEGGRDPEPNKSLQNVVYNEVTGGSIQSRKSGEGAGDRTWRRQ